MELSEFRLEQAIIECRYPSAFRFWDHAGSLWEPVLRKWPEFAPSKVEPAKTEFVKEDRLFLVASTEMAAVRSMLPNRDLKEFLGLAQMFMPVVNTHLALTDYTRIGTRFIFWKSFPDIKSASAAFVETGLLSIPGERFFGLDNQQHAPDYSVRFSDGKYGATVRLSAEAEKVELPGSPIWGIEPKEYARTGIIFDVDYYTLQPVAVDSMRFDEYIDQIARMVRRDSPAFIGGRL